MADTLNPAQEDRATFLGAPPPEEIQKQAQIPAKEAAPPPPPTPPPPKVSAHMVGLAASLGLTPEEAQGFESDAELSRALSLAAKFRQAPPAPQTATPATPPTPPEEVDFPEFDDRYDQGFIDFAKKARAVNAHWKKRFEDLEKQLPEMVQRTHAQMSAAQQVTQLIGDAMQETGYDRTTLTPELRQRIADMGHALYQSASKSGQKPDEKQIVKAVLPLVMGQATTATTTTAPRQQPAPTPPVNGHLNTAIEAQRAAIAAQRERDEKGRFAPGAPTHRASEVPGSASELRRNLLDLGADPGDAPAAVAKDFFLK
jgi:hypothetical protein